MGKRLQKQLPESRLKKDQQKKFMQYKPLAYKKKVDISKGEVKNPRR